MYTSKTHQYINTHSTYAYVGDDRESGERKAKFRWSGLGIAFHLVGYCPTVALTPEECAEVAAEFIKRKDTENARAFEWGEAVLKSNNAPQPQN